MPKNPRQYPDTMPSAESGRPMARGEKEVALTIDGKTFTYLQPGWWCSLTNPDDIEGQLVDEDNMIAEMARRAAKALARCEKL
jgi:HTH-type transcriptional regulator / antitoxin MqsA